MVRIRPGIRPLFSLTAVAVLAWLAALAAAADWWDPSARGPAPGGPGAPSYASGQPPHGGPRLSAPPPGNRGGTPGSGSETRSGGNRLAAHRVYAATSADGIAWTQTRLAGPFDLATAPNANGLFLGDYMGLAGAGGDFLALFVRTTGDAANRNDVFFARAAAGAGAQQAKAAPVAPAFTVDAAWAERVDAAIGRALAARGRAPPP